MYVLDYSVANVAIPYISGDLAVSTDEGTYVITAFAVGNAIGLPLTGWLADRFGRLRSFLLSIALFTFFSWVCGASFNLEMLVIGRFIQGLVAGPLVPLSQGFIGEVNPPEKAHKAMSFWALIITVGPVVGPVLGGYICVDFSWPWIFFINIPLGIICVLGIWLILKGKESEIIERKFDYLGFILFALGATCLQIFLDKGQEWDWFNSKRIILLFVTFILSYCYLIPWQRICKHPFLNLDVFRYRTFSLASILIAVSYAAYFGSLVLIPLWLQSYMGYNALWAGIAICPLGIGPVTLSILVPKMIENVGKLVLIMTTMLIFIISFIYFMYFTTNVDLQHVMISRFIMGLGFVTYAAPLNLLAMQDLPHKDMPGGLGIFHFIRSIFGGIGTSVFTTLWQRRTIFHHERLASTITDFRTPIVGYFDTAATENIPTDVATATMNALVDGQAAFLALLDAFYSMIWACAALFFLALLYLIVFYKSERVPLIDRLLFKKDQLS